MAQYSVLLFSDEPLLAHGFLQATASAERIHAWPATGDFAIFADPSVRPDMVVIDHAPGRDLREVEDLHRVLPKAMLVLWTRSIAPAQAFAAISAGVRGIVSKMEPGPSFVDRLNRIADGEVYIDRSVAQESVVLPRPAAWRSDQQLVQRLAALEAAVRRQPVYPIAPRPLAQRPAAPAALPATPPAPIARPPSAPTPPVIAPPVIAPPAPKPNDPWRHMRIAGPIAAAVLMIAPLVAVEAMHRRIPATQAGPAKIASTADLISPIVEPPRRADLVLSEASWKGSEHRRIAGTLVNRGNKRYGEVKVVFQLLDRARHQLGTVSATVDDVAPNETAGFLTKEVPPNVSGYLVSEIREVKEREVKE